MALASALRSDASPFAGENIHGKKMLRRAEFLLTRALRRAGWK
jgi:hypothetical protein